MNSTLGRRRTGGRQPLDRAAAHGNDHRQSLETGRLRHRDGRQIAFWAIRRSSIRRNGASMNTSVFSAGRTVIGPTCRTSSSLGYKQPPLGSDRRAILRGTEPVEEKEYLTDAFAREAVAFIHRHQAKPFFLYLAFNAVHTPMHATDDRLATRRRSRTKCGEQPIARCSWRARRSGGPGPARKCADCGLAEDTLIFFCSDNGGPTGPAGRTQCVAPIRQLR